MSYSGGWPPYVPVAKRRANAAREMKKLVKKGVKIEPVLIQGRKIARTFWGEAWCNHLEKFSDYANRLPRGRTYARNGSVCHLSITKGKIEAIVSGSELYNIGIDISPLPATKWKQVCKQCAGQIGSMLELLQGRFADGVMEVVTDQNKGLFPGPSEIKLSCDCPDWAGMCKHLAAVMYGVGARLDDQPELLFLLRDVDQEALIAVELDTQLTTAGTGNRRRLAGADLSDVFGVDMDEPTRAGVRPKKVDVATNKAVAESRKGFVPSAAAVVQLRYRFGMSVPRFAKLIGVSPSTVMNWEKSHGKLTLHRRSLNALTQAAELTPKQQEEYGS